MRWAKTAIKLVMVGLMGMVLSGCSDNGVANTTSTTTATSVSKTTTLSGSLILPILVNKELMARIAAQVASPTSTTSTGETNVTSYVNGLEYPIKIDATTMNFVVSEVPTGVDSYRIEVTWGKIGLKTQVKSTESIVMSAQTTAAVLVADQLHEDPMTVLETHGNDLSGLTKMLETAFQSDVASVTTNVLTLTDIIDEVKSSAEVIQAGGTAPVTTSPADLASTTLLATSSEDVSSILPEVQLVDPASGAMFLEGTEISLKAVATESSGSIVKVEFYEGTKKIGDKMGYPYDCTWTPEVAGTYSLHAKAYDSNGKMKSGLPVLIQVVAQPSISIQSPQHNATFRQGDQITIETVVSGVAECGGKVEFFQNEIKLGESSSSPYSFVWENVPKGSYQLSAKIVLPFTDAQWSNSTIVSLVDIEVVGESNNNPTVAISQPGNNSKYLWGTDVTIKVNASDTDGTIAKVEYYLGLIKLGQSDEAPFSYFWEAPPVGSYSIVARAFDNDGAEGRSSAIPISVEKDGNQEPVISVTNPVSGSTIPFGATVNLTALAYDQDGSVKKVEFFIGSAKLGESTTVPYLTKWVAMPAGKHSLTAQATDNLGKIKISNPVEIVIDTPQ